MTLDVKHTTLLTSRKKKKKTGENLQNLEPDRVQSTKEKLIDWIS